MDTTGLITGGEWVNGWDWWGVVWAIVIRQVMVICNGKPQRERTFHITDRMYLFIFGVCLCFQLDLRARMEAWTANNKEMFSREVEQSLPLEEEEALEVVLLEVFSMQQVSSTNSSSRETITLETLPTRMPTTEPEPGGTRLILI